MHEPDPADYGDPPLQGEPIAWAMVSLALLLLALGGCVLGGLLLSIVAGLIRWGGGDV